MQKKLLGMAVAAALAAPAVALAQSAVQVYGTAHLSFNQSKFGNSTNGVPSVTKFGVDQHASNWGLRSTETLGGGMTAWFQAEFNMKMARDNGVFDGDSTARNSGVGLRGNFGNVYVGTWETPWAQTFRLWDVGTIGGWGPTTSIIGRRENTARTTNFNCVNNSGTPGGAPLNTTALICGGGAAATSTGNLGYALWRRYQSSVFYESPLFEGVQAKFAWMPNMSKSTVAVPTTGAAAVGPLAAGAERTAKEWGVGLAVPLGPGKIGASYAKAKKLEGAGAPTGTNDTGAKMLNLGYEWALSKRTALGFGVAKIDNGADQQFTWTNQLPNANGASQSSVQNGVDQTNIFVSIRHSF